MERRYSGEEERFYRKRILPEEDRTSHTSVGGKSFRWFRSHNIVCIEHFRRHQGNNRLIEVPTFAIRRLRGRFETRCQPCNSSSSAFASFKSSASKPSVNSRIQEQVCRELALLFLDFRARGADRVLACAFTGMISYS